MNRTGPAFSHRCMRVCRRGGLWCPLHGVAAAPVTVKYPGCGTLSATFCRYSLLPNCQGYTRYSCSRIVAAPKAPVSGEGPTVIQYSCPFRALSLAVRVRLTLLPLVSLVTSPRTSTDILSARRHV